MAELGTIRHDSQGAWVYLAQRQGFPPAIIRRAAEATDA